MRRMEKRRRVRAARVMRILEEFFIGVIASIAATLIARFLDGP